ncbi:GroES-like protein [Athelia psychrophila]|uniref:GroES-like protein n=1 Tax=Athelia psychrophila TaxID=1759441 RepID=A0A166EDQ2_9AGAM|nr:GroES-like protein [Fibularhizoctonia sp. CBS 109695]
MSTHTAIATTSLGVLGAIQVTTEKPGPGEILLKTSHSSMIAFDTYDTDHGFRVQEYPMTLGFNAAGIVAAVGDGVTDLAVGDRITAFAYQGSRSKAMQEYTILSRTVCAKIPDNLPLDAAATIPDNFVTAFWALFDNFNLTFPSDLSQKSAPPSADTPILIYGAGATSGQYAIQLLKIAGYTNISATASAKHHTYLRALGAHHVFDYNSATLSSDIESAAGGKVAIALDCITAEDTLAVISKLVSPEGTVGLLLPIKEGNTLTTSAEGKMGMELTDETNPFPKTVKVIGVKTFTYQTNEYLKENLMPKILPALLAEGLIQPNRVRLLKEGSFKARVETGLDLLRRNAVSGEKIVVQIA